MREQLGILHVKVEQRLSDELPFALVRCENRAIGEAGFHVVQLPGQIDGVVEGCVHALTGFWGVDVTAVPTHKDAEIECVFFRNSLANGVDRIPFDAIPADLVGFEDIDCSMLHFFNRSRLPRVPVFVGG